jgi:hypothetical protein
VTAAELAERLPKGSRRDGWYDTRCPAHEDRRSSFSFRDGDRGIIVKCRAGCTVESIASALGMSVAALFHERNGGRARRSSAQHLTVAELATAKGIAADVLASFGVEQDGNAVKITYRRFDGSPAPRQRRRTALIAKAGSFWSRGEDALTPYGEWRIGDARARRYVWLVEGESDAWALWSQAIAALGLPGCDTAKLLTAEHLKDIDRLFISREPDRGGDTFVRGIGRRLRELGWTGEARVVSMPDGVKDIADLLRDDPEKFLDRLRTQAHAAPRLEQVPAEEESSSAYLVTKDSSPVPVVSVVLPAPASAAPPLAATLQIPDSALLGLGRQFAALYARYLEVPATFLYFSFLTYLGAILARKITLDSELRPQPRLYTVLLGESADTRKSTALRKTDEFFGTLGTKQWTIPVLFGVGSAEGIAAELNQRHDLILHFDEFKSFVEKARNQHSVALPMVATLFERSDYDNRTKTERLSVRNGAVSLLAACTADTYSTMFDQQFLAIGFLNRLWIVKDRATKRIAVPRMIPAPELDELRAQVVAQLEAIDRAWVANGQKPVPYRLTPGALAIFQTWYEARVGSIFERRLDTYGHRLMLLLAATTGKDVIDEPIVEAVVALLRYQLEVRRETDPIDAENTIAGVEEKIRRVLARGALKDRELKRAVHYNRVGLWMYNTALENLKRAREVAHDPCQGLFWLVDAAEPVTTSVTTTKTGDFVSGDALFHDNRGVQPPPPSEGTGCVGGTRPPETTTLTSNGEGLHDAARGGDKFGDNPGPSDHAEGCDCAICVPELTEAEWS